MKSLSMARFVNLHPELSHRVLTFSLPLALLCTTVQAQTIRSIPQEQATVQNSLVRVWPGRSATLDFSRTGEVITYLLLGDPSRIVYTTDAPLPTKQAKAVFLKQTKPIKFPGATSAWMTSLVVRTETPTGRVHQYNFNVIPATGTVEDEGIAIVPPQVVGQNYTLEAIDQGLRVAIQKGYTSASDPVVFKVQQFLQLVRDHTPIPEAAAEAKLSMEVVNALERLGQAAYTSPAGKAQ